MDADDKPMIVVNYTGEDTAADMSSTLTSVRQSAEFNYGGPVYHAVINTPAYFSPTQREAIMIAAAKAGFRAVEIITKPNLEAIASHIQKKTMGGEKNVLVFHVAGAGGGPDYSLITISKKRGKTLWRITKSLWRMTKSIGKILLTAVIAQILENLG